MSVRGTALAWIILVLSLVFATARARRSARWRRGRVVSTCQSATLDKQ